MKPRRLLVIAAGTALAGLGGCYAGSRVELGYGHCDVVLFRVGTRGAAWATTEGEAYSLVGREPFRFTAQDPAVADALLNVKAGSVVRLRYKEHFTAWPPSGENRHVVTGVDVVPRGRVPVATPAP